MICLLGLGASIGDQLLGNRLQPAQQRLALATWRLQQMPHCSLLAQSPLYLSRAWGNLRTGAYLNAVALMDTLLPPATLLQRLLQIEHACGRRRHRKRWGKRAVDIDILLLDNLRLHSHCLQVPHPWLWQREFALRPACDLLQAVASTATTRDRVELPRTWAVNIARHLRRQHGYHLSRPLRILSVTT